MHSKLSLVEEESYMKRNKFEALALLQRRVQEMRANGEMDAQQDAGAATQPEKQIEEKSRDFKSSFCEFRNKRVKCRNVEDLSGRQIEGREAKCTVRVSKHHCTQTFRGVRRPHRFCVFG